MAQYHLIEVGLNPRQIKTLQDCIENGEGCVFKLSNKSIANPNTNLMVNSVKYRRWMAAKENGKGFHLKINKKEASLNRNFAGKGISGTSITCRECGQPLKLGRGIGDTLKSMGKTVGSKVLEDPSNLGNLEGLKGAVSSTLEGLKNSDPRATAAAAIADVGLNAFSKIADKYDDTGRSGTTLLEVNKYIKDLDPIGLINYAIEKIGDAIAGRSQYDAEQAAKNYNNAVASAREWLNSSEASQRNAYQARLAMLSKIPNLPGLKRAMKKATPDTFAEYKEMMREVATRTPMSTETMLARHRKKIGLGMKAKPKGQKKSLDENLSPENKLTAQSIMNLRNHLSMNQPN
jgi:hypothetical protein